MSGLKIYLSGKSSVIEETSMFVSLKNSKTIIGERLALGVNALIFNVIVH